MNKITPYPSIEHFDVKSNSNRVWHSDKEDEKDNYKYYIEEKIDGSQLSILIDGSDNQIKFYNKNKQIDPNNNAFSKAVMILEQDKFKKILNPDYIYHGESVCNVKHNVNVYKRTPKNYFVLFDIYDKINNKYLTPTDKINEAQRVGFEVAPILYQNNDPLINPLQKCQELINSIEQNKLESFLGGKIEGVVLKHDHFVKNGKTVATKLKFVTPEFKERHITKQTKVNYSADDFLKNLGLEFATDARYQKAYRHLKERDNLDDSKINITKMIQELNNDFDKEFKEELMLQLWIEFRPILQKYSRNNLDSWMKNNINKEKLDN